MSALTRGRIAHWVAVSVLAALYVVYYITFSEKPEDTTVLFSLFYVIIVSYENVCCMALFLIGPTSGIVISIVVCGIIVGMLSCLKFFSLEKQC